MSIKAYEFKKVITSPVIIALTVIFMIFNIFIIFSNIYYNRELKILNKIVDKFGYEINDEMMADFQIYYNEQLKSVNEITYGKTSRTYNSAGELLTDYSNSHFYNKEEVKFLSEVGVIENYYNIAKNIDESYKTINIAELGESGIATYKLSGQAAETVKNQYEKLADRFEELKENGEHKNLFFIGKVYKMHKLLFNDLFRCFIFETVILVVLITAYLLNYEFENKTHLLAYSTKRGRKLNRDKFCVSVFVTVLVTTIIISTSLAIYFCVFDYSGIFNIPISSGFNWEYALPYISWWNMSFVQYLLCCIGIVYFCEIIFTAITYIICCFIRNSYMVFFTFAAIFGLALMIPGFMPTYSNAIFLSQFTPFVLCTNSINWFMEKGALATFKFYEITTIIVWSLILIIMCGICTKRFKKQNIY